MRRRLERGQAIILVLVAMALFLIGALGLAIDASHLYAQRQMAQTAADAAARAAIFTILSGTNTAGGTKDYQNAFTLSNFDCDASAQKANWTPCYFAKQAGFSPANGDTVGVKFPTSVPGVTVSPGWALGPGPSPGAVQVTIIRPVQTGLIRFLGPSTAKVAAQATAAIIRQFETVPILVLHPSLPGSFRAGGNSTVTICGGARQSIQVNSRDAQSITPGSGTIDLRWAGIKATVNPITGIPNCDGQGADFGDKGGPATYPGILLLGADGKYRQPKGPIFDPLESVPSPSTVGLPVDPPKLPVPYGKDGCPTDSKIYPPCKLYQPGVYTTGILVGKTGGETALFAPGLYYMQSGGFKTASNGFMLMAQCDAPADPTTTPPLPAIPRVDPDFGCGMMVYNTGSDPANDIFSMGSNGSVDLRGSANNGAYQGILFFQDHDGAAHNTLLSNPPSNAHKLGGGGRLKLQGTIYLTNATAGFGRTRQTGNPSYFFQQLLLRGGSGGSVLACDPTAVDDSCIIGQIIVDTVDLGGGGKINMVLCPTCVKPVDEVALVK